MNTISPNNNGAAYSTDKLLRFSSDYSPVDNIRSVLFIAKKHNDHGTGIPRHEMEALARLLLPDIRAFYESEESKREFAEWKASKEKKNKQPS